ncbi:MAG: hypothetical protein KKC84_03230 [Candidatus Omnitrophica bacterium]|nr:hypothetical protein [Candidatus Omnitrophota bacterium]
MPKESSRGVVLVIVIATIIVITALINVILGMMNSQSRLTHHQVSRIQSQYATQAAINYTLEKLRLGSWEAPATKYLCKSGGHITEPDLPPGIHYVEVTIAAAGSGTCSPPAGVNACVSAKAVYSFDSAPPINPCGSLPPPPEEPPPEEPPPEPTPTEWYCHPDDEACLRAYDARPCITCPYHGGPCINCAT